jgi:uncharacterized protein (TIGR00369 family)
LATDEEAFFWRIHRGELPAPPCAATLGLKFTAVSAEEGTIEAEFEGKPEFTNPTGNIQGGFLAAMLDDAMGPALAATLKKGEFAPTLNLNVSFLRPGKVGRFQATARIVRRGRDVCYLSGELLQEGELVATASATALVRKLA